MNGEDYNIKNFDNYKFKFFDQKNGKTVRNYFVKPCLKSKKFNLLRYIWKVVEEILCQILRMLKGEEIESSVKDFEKLKNLRYVF